MNPDYDFIVIGSGVLGCLAYDYFVSHKNKVLLISEGNTTNNDKNIIQTGPQYYSGILYGRKKGLGGTSQLWGGAMNTNFENKFIKECKTKYTNFENERKRVLDFFGIRDIKLKPKKKIYSSKKYTIYEEEILWPSFSRRNVFKNLKKKHRNFINLKMGTYKKVIKKGDIFHVFVSTDLNKDEVFTCKKVIFCMGFFDNVSENLNENESFKFKEHLSSPIGIISNTENCSLSSSLSFNLNHFKTKRYEIFDNNHNRSIGFFHLSNIKSDFLIKFREFLICLQSLKVPPLKLIYEIIVLSYQLFPILKNLIINNGDISNKKNKSFIHLVVDKAEFSNIKKSNNEIKIDWSITEADIKFFNNLKKEMSKIIKFIIRQSSSPQTSYKTLRTVRPEEIYHPFSGLRKKKWEDSEYIWSGTHALQYLGSLSPTLASHFLKIKEYENARKNMCDYIN